MPQSFTSIVSSTPLRFLMTGPITAWDPISRLLTIGGRRLRVAPMVSVVGALGTLVTASGHQEDSSARWMVTQLTRD
jgi:hypothetical protein